MAAPWARLVFLLQICSLYERIYGDLDDLGVITNQAIALNARFTTLLSSASGYAAIKNSYDDASGDDLMQLRQVDGLDAVKTMAVKIGSLMQSKVDALNESVEFAEKLAENYRWNTNLESSDVDWVNSKKVNESEEGYGYSPKFKQNANFHNSSVHIPVEIYDGDIEILNGLSWTSRLEEQWQRNLQKDNALLWQYFGSQSGIFRKYPATKWRGRGVDLYDVRRRPWYTQGASSPKDMLILVDTSGSTHGQALTLMKQSVRSLIDTLGENDFVNIAYFSETAGIVGCFKTFVQANHINKQILFNSVEKMEAKGMASYTVGLEFAFEQFREFYEKAEEGEGAKCNKIIMFLTDGGTEIPEDVIRKYNWPEKRTRIFGYAVGPTANPIAAVKWIACSNKGYFARIPAMGAIRSTVQNYYRKTSLGLVSARAQQIHWTHSYNDHGGLGLMTTVTLPVYNRTADIARRANQTILGVMGCDVTIEEMLAFTPTKVLGASGYVFAINTNGYVMFHPNLKAQNGWLDNPPNVDFLDVEQDTPEKRLLRRDMINGLEGCKTITSWSLTLGEMHMDNTTRTYCYTRIPGSNFSLAVVTEGEESYYLQNAQAANGKQYLSSDDTAILVAPWKFCEQVVQIYNGTAPSEEMIYHIQKSDTGNCSQDLLNHLLFDAVITENVESVWKSLSSIGIDARFLTTNGGLTRIYPASAKVLFENDLDPMKTQFYQRAMNTDSWLFYASYHKGLSQPNGTEPVVSAVKSVVLTDGKYKPAVAGVHLEQSHLREKLLSSVSSCRDPNIVCYLLDDGGYLILSSDEEDKFKVGQFFGDVDLVLMKHLVNSTIYMKNEKYDYQAACPVEKPTVSAGPRSVFVPAVMDALTVNWWTTKFAWLYMQFNIYDWLYGYLTHTEAASVPGDEEADAGNRSCIKLTTQYYFSDVKRANKDEAVCGNCTREYAAARLDNSNLLLVIVEGDCYGICDTTPLNSFPVEKELFTEDPTSCKLEKRYRARPAECYDYDEREDDSDCGAANNLLPSMLLLTGLQMLILLLMQSSYSC